MKTRVLTGFYITIALILFFVSRLFTLIAFDILIGFLAVVAAVEVARVLERSRKFNTIFLAGIYPAVLYTGLLIGFGKSLRWHYFLILFICIYIAFMLASFLLTLLCKKSTNREILRYKIDTTKLRYAIDKAFNTGFVLIYPTMLFASLFMLNHYTQLYIVTQNYAVNKNIFGFFFLLLSFIITVSCDTIAMLVGSKLKGPKLCPRISPSKTISGAIAGLVAGMLSAWLLYLLFMANAEFAAAFATLGSGWLVLLIGLLAAAFCQLGDILASYLKRRARVKDYGTIFPGHGGVMDRVDGLIFTSTFILLVVVTLLF